MRVRHLLFIGSLAVVPLVGCAPPKQAPLPEIEDEGGLDTGAGEKSSTSPGGDEAAGASGEGDSLEAEKEDMRAKCCPVCRDALAKDKSGRKPEEIPCADFTVDLNPWCLEYFRDTPTKASECADGAPAAPPAG